MKKLCCSEKYQNQYFSESFYIFCNCLTPLYRRETDPVMSYFGSLIFLNFHWNRHTRSSNANTDSTGALLCLDGQNSERHRKNDAAPIQSKSILNSGTSNGETKAAVCVTGKQCQIPIAFGHVLRSSSNPPTVYKNSFPSTSTKLTVSPTFRRVNGPKCCL